MAVNTGAGEVGILLVIKNRRVIRVEGAQGTDGPGDVTDLTEQWKQDYSQSVYGCRPVETIYETKQTQSPDECFMIIAGKRIKIPCT
jgi:hypothetical protein